MLWFTLALLTALAAASQDAWVKKFFSHLSIYEMGMFPLFFSLPLFLVAFFLNPIPPTDSIFWLSIFASLALNAAAYFLYMTAIKTSPLSLTIPFLAFTPAIMVFTGWLILGEMPNLQGILGIGIILVGSYILNIHPGQWSLFGPLKSALKEKGSRLVLLVASFYSFSAVIDKMAILHSSPTFFGVFFYLIFSLVLILWLAVTGTVPLHSYRKHAVLGFGSGLIVFVHAILHVWAISLTKAAYMISVKRLSVLFSILYGKVLFHEPNIRIRFLGGAIMLSGAILIGTGG